MFRYLMFASGLALMCGALFLSRHEVQGENAPGKEEQIAAGVKFRKNCQHCHRPPDLQFASDAAWLDQLKRTA